MGARVPEGFSGNEIAVIGMAGRFPGAATLDAFWRNLKGGVESIRALSDEELLAAGVPPAYLADPNYVKAAASLDGIEQWDAAFWGFTPLDASVMDPQHRLFLECAYEALEHAGHAPAAFPGAIGVYGGCGMQAYLPYNLLPNRKLMDSAGLFLVRHTGNDKDFLATRVSYALNLRGPSINVQTACSTSLVAIHLAALSLIGGECDLALAGGVTIEVPHGHGYHYREGEILSPDGHCRAFDAASRGTVFGSGAGVVVLRRLAEALAGGDTVYAVIRGSAVNNDGSLKVGYLAPSVDGQAASVVEALGVAGVSPGTITYVETHGTGTPVGDPIEVAALTQAFRSGTAATGFCGIGSLKTNIGHTDTAAGVASFIKTVLALRHRQLPPSLHYRSPNPAIDFAGSPFYLNATLKDWRSEGPRRAGVSALGVGGTNAHVILEEAPALPPTTPSRPFHLLLHSAKSRTALDRMSADLADHLVEEPALDLADVAFTLQVGRTAHRERRALVARDRDEARALLDSLDRDRVTTATAAEQAGVAFLFAGGGAQSPRMGEGLYRAEPVYRETVDEGLAQLKSLAPFDLRALLYPAAGDEERARAELERPAVALPALFLTQLALARLWMSWGIVPATMIGHSMGEYTAACLAGVFSPTDALALVTLRGRLFETIPAGGMLSVPLAEHDLRPLLGAELAIAAVNAPGLCVASGPAPAIAALERVLAAREVDARRVPINVAAHSPMLEPILQEFGAFLRTQTLRAPQRPFVSNLTGTWITGSEATDPEYWVRHLRHTVRFGDGVDRVLQDPDAVLLEVGPGRVLASLAKQHPGAATRTIVTSLPHADEDVPDVASVLGALGRMWAAGVPVDWAPFWARETRRRIALPGYPWERQRHWVDPPAPSGAAAEPPEPDTARRTDIGAWFHRPVWREVAPPVASDARRRVLAFVDDAFSEALAARLAASHDVTCVRPGAAFAATPAGFTVRLSVADDYAALIAALHQRAAVPAEIAHAWARPEGGLDTVADAEDRAFFSLLHLAQALGREDVTAPTRLTVVTRGMHSVAGEPISGPLQAVALGPVRVIPRELPNVRARAVDLPAAVEAGSRQEARLLDALVAEIGADAPGETVAWRGRARFIQEVAPVRLSEGPTRLREGGVYLVTGGLGGIGYVVAEHLARSLKARLVLAGRSASPQRHSRQIEALEALGAEVMVAAMDVTQADEVAGVVAKARERFGAVHGVFHAAGVLDDGPLLAKTRAAADAVLGPKVSGTLALDAALDGPLDCFVLFSSVSALVGPAGQIDYAAANAFLDAFAQARADRDGTAVLAVGWSAWRDVGMVARLAAGPGGPAAARHPWLGRCVHAAAGAELFAVELATTTHWVLDEHRIRGGHALMPGTGYLEIVRAALASRPEPRPLEIRDVAFVSPFVVDDGVPRELRVHLDRGTGQVVVAGRAGGEQDEASWQEHVTATARYVEEPRPAPLDLAAVRGRCPRVEHPDAAQHPHLRFGPRWGSVRQIAYGATEALADLELPGAFRDDVATLTLHPAILDQATACAQALVPGFDPAADFYVPLSYTRLLQFAPLTARVASHIRLVPSEFDPKELVVFDITVADASGAALVVVSDFIMARVTDKAQLSGELARRAVPRRTGVAFDDPPPRAQARGVAGLEEAIAPSEGVEALRRLLRDATAPHTLVVPRAFDAMRRDLTAEPRAGPPPAPAPRPLPLDEIEAVLGTHEAVRQAVVLARANRPGDVKLVAYCIVEEGRHVTVSELRRFLKGRLPAALVPSTFVTLDALPLTPDGFVDRAALPDPFGAADDHVAPRTDTEKLVADIWTEVLGVERVSVHDNFFDVGGHSLLAVRVVTKIDKRLGVRLNQATMILQTLEQIAAECDRRRGPGGGAGGGGPAPGEVPAAAPAGGLKKILKSLSGR